ncbi:MAG: J domain-containing protein [bacterium]
MPAKTTYYDVLGITRAAPAEIVSAVYRAWMKAMRAHPDLGGDEEFAKELNAAYEILRNPESRAAYDAQLVRERGADGGEGVRRAPRVSVSTEIAFCVPPDGTWIRAETMDASVLGLRMCTTEPLEEGVHVAVAFPSSPGSAVDATVRWTRAAEGVRSRTFEAGIEFYHPLPDVLKRLGVRMR